MRKISVEKLMQFNGHEGSVYTVCASLNTGKIYSGGADGFVVEWNRYEGGDGKLVCRLQRPVYSICELHEAGLLLVGTAAGNLHVFDLVSNKEIKNIALHKNGLFDMKVSGNTLITAGADGCIALLDKDDLQVKKMLKLSEKSARAISVHPSKPGFAIGFSDHLVRIVDPVSYQVQQVLEGHESSVFAVAYSPDGRHLLSGGRDAMLKRWDATAAYAPLNSVVAHRLHINTIAWAPDGGLFATASMDKTIKIWDSGAFELIKVIDKPRNNGHLHSVNKSVWLDNTSFASVSDDKSVMLWKVIS